ncbi:predicted protein [Ostreococcus lucimarinus CCE9901]|uniref:Uncharacterized protein n=1 Tax=Ostreococcus lucimarinus (strain CCE9901) TaxID=436017 RepID=A4RSP6_OSTLU|nr:predicted protein [Ostreococcus lucimarinus CCE9901]ABO94747.1 predicted protein [Ostreococcus lucimarinus CCE9901]|eukprot:XP_001416454.1 predicted protein [Ostreococcus lucimarinus CCE9901]
MLRHYWKAWDSIISKVVFSCADWLGWELDPLSPTTSHLPAITSPTPLITSLLVYLVTVVVSYRVLSATTNTKIWDPTWLKASVICHNAFLILLSLYMCIGCIVEAYKSGYKLWGNKFNVNEKQLAFYIYLFYVSKIYEFVDTFIMLLKRNLRQVSFLHVYHHSTISFIWWMIARRAPGGDAYFSAALNSWVHVCMYTYYLLSALIGKNNDKRVKYLWWGRHLTQMQMLQFLCNLLQAVYCAYFSEYPKFLSKILLFYMISLLALFGHFYYSKHIATAKLRKKHTKKA